MKGQGENPRPKPETRRKKRRAVGTKLICTGGGEYKLELSVYESYAVVTEKIEEATARGHVSIELHRPDDSMQRSSSFNRGEDIYWNTIEDWDTPGTVLRVMVSQVVTWNPRLVTDV